VLQLDFGTGFDVLGASTVYTDRPTVQKVQLALQALPGFHQDPLFRSVNIDGSITTSTINALARFNSLYGTPSDGGTITDDTLAALVKAATDDRPMFGPAPAPPSAPAVDNRPMFGPAPPPVASAVSPAAAADNRPMFGPPEAPKTTNKLATSSPAQVTAAATGMSNRKIAALCAVGAVGVIGVGAGISFVLKGKLLVAALDFFILTPAAVVATAFGAAKVIADEKGVKA
jgi:hypothetical protein